MKDCPNCGNLVGRGHRFCRHCGARLNRLALNKLYVGIGGGLLLFGVSAWSLTYFYFKDSPANNKERQSPIDQIQSTAAKIPTPTEPAQVAPDSSVAQNPAVELPPETVKGELSVGKNPSGSDIQKQPPSPKKEQAPRRASNVATGSYEVIQTTNVHSLPKEDSDQVAVIEPGTKVHVVASRGNWLEIRSKHGRPPGFIKKEAAVPQTASVEPPPSEPRVQQPTTTKPENQKSTQQAGDLNWIKRIIIQSQEGQVLLTWNAGEPRMIDFSGKTFLEVPGSYSSREFTGWNTDMNYRANHLYDVIVPPLVSSLMDRIDRSAPFSGFRLRIFATTIPSQPEWEQEFMANRMQKWGWEAKRARRVRETFDYIINLENAQKFKHALLSRSELKGLTLAMVDERERIWGPR